MSGKSIDDEFAELQQEIERVTTLPPSGANDVTGVVNALHALKAQWDKRVAERFDQPVWRRRIDEAIQGALQRVLQSGQTVDRHGNLGFMLEGDAVQKYAGPVVKAALDGLEQAFVDKWVQKPAAEGEPEKKKSIDAADLGGVLSLLFRDKMKPKK